MAVAAFLRSSRLFLECEGYGRGSMVSVNVGINMKLGVLTSFCVLGTVVVRVFLGGRNTTFYIYAVFFHSKYFICVKIQGVQ